jgi:hypothetical protein
MMVLLVIAVILFVLGFLTVKLLWWAALICAVLWVVGMVRPGRRIFR